MSRELQRLMDEVVLREASLRDARSEFEANELEASELAVIEERETKALADLANRIAALDADDPEGAPVEVTPRRRRKSLLAVALLCFAVAAGITLWSAVALRQPGSSATGSISASDAKMLQALLNEGELDVAKGNVAAALAAYDAALEIDSTNSVALTQSGWFYFTTGSEQKNLTLVQKETNRLRQAVSVAPTSPSAHLYYGIAALSTPGNHQLALSEFRRFLKLNPPPVLQLVAKPYLAQLGLSTK